jgi:hypothetical protein
VPIDTSTAAGKAFLDMLRVFAEFETNLSNEREGIPKAKARGVCVSRTKLNRARVRELWQEGMRAAAIAKAIGCSRAGSAARRGRMSDATNDACKGAPCKGGPFSFGACRGHSALQPPAEHCFP